MLANNTSIFGELISSGLTSFSFPSEAFQKSTNIFSGVRLGSYLKVKVFIVVIINQSSLEIRQNFSELRQKTILELDFWKFK